MANKLIIINVLSKDSYEDCHIPDSVSVPLLNLKKYAEKLDKDSEIIVHCSSYQCTASRQAWQILDEMGFKNVHAYVAGIREWYQHGMPVEGVCKFEYLNELNLRGDTDDETTKTISTRELQNKLKHEVISQVEKGEKTKSEKLLPPEQPIQEKVKKERKPRKPKTTVIQVEQPKVEEEKKKPFILRYFPWIIVCLISAIILALIIFFKFKL